MAKNPKKKSAPLPVDSPERRRLPILLRHAWFSLNQAFRRRILHLGITPDQFTALRTLLEAGEAGLTQTELTRIMSSDPNTIASLVSRMEKSGLLKREVHEEDRRANRIQLLPVGKNKYEVARQLALGLQSEILSSLPEEDREQFLENLAKIAEASREIAEKEVRRGK